MRDEKLYRYFTENPGWQRQLELLRKKALAGYADGQISLTDATAEECAAAEGLLGHRFTPPKLRYKISAFESALRVSIFAVEDMQQFWQRLDGESLIPHAAQKQAHRDVVARFFEREAAQPHGSAALAWLDTLAREKRAGFQILAPHIETDKEARRWLHEVCCTLDRLERSLRPEELALCSYAVTTDPHALDSDQSAGRLLLHALAHWKQQAFPQSGRDRAALYRQCGLLTDDLSSITVQRGLRLLCPDGSEHPAYRLLRLQGSLCVLTASQLDKLKAQSPTGQVYILENQMVFSSLCRWEGIRHPMICTSGQLREASWRLLDLLAASGCSFWYAGDFDPEGLSIADRLWQEYGSRVHMWHMGVEEYRQSQSDHVHLDDSRLTQLSNLRCPALHPLADALLQHRTAGYQEALVDLYLQDLQQ